MRKDKATNEKNNTRETLIKHMNENRLKHLEEISNKKVIDINHYHWLNLNTEICAYQLRARGHQLHLHSRCTEADEG